MSGRWDGSLGGVQFRVVRDEDGASYRRSITRTGLQSQQLSDNAYQTRIDQPGFLQTDWSGGSAWQRPLIAGNNSSMFAESSGFDTWSTPGTLIPVNSFESTQYASIGQYAKATLDWDNNLNIIGDTNTVDGTHRDTYTWSGSAWVKKTYHCFVLTTDSNKVTASFLLGDYIWVATQDFDAGSLHYPKMDLSYYNDSGGLNHVIAQRTDAYHGTSVFPYQGVPWYYNGDTLSRLNDPYGTPTLEVIEDDGHGIDWLHFRGNLPNNDMRWEDVQLAVPTTEGIYYVKNVKTEAGVTPYVYRVEVDSLGAWTGVPVATLNPGTVCINIIWHLGSLIMATTSDLHAVNPDTSDKALITLYHLTGGSIGVLGQPEGGTTISEAVWKFLGSDGPLLYVAGKLGVWVYDGVRGGITKMADHNVYDGGSFDVTPKALHNINGQILLYALHYTISAPTTPRSRNGAATGTLGTDYDTHHLDSGYFDFGLPTEQKTISTVRIQTDGTMTATEQYTIQVSADDAAWVTVAEHSNADNGIYSFTPIVGYRFRYKIAFETSVGNTPGFRAIHFQATAGENVRSWDLVLDNTEFRNVENELVDPKVFVDLLESAILNNSTLSYVDGFESYDPSDQTTYTVKVQSYSNDKGNPNEGGVRLNLIEI